jgi:RHS repeat-associated protein
VAFTVRGPNGWVGFSNLVSDSGLISLTNSGGYTLTAQGTVDAYDIAYAFKLVETVQTDLALGTTFTGQFVGSAQAQLFRITITNSGPLRIVLANVGGGNNVELFAGRSGAPTRGVFDYPSVPGSGGNREILIPNASVGTVYVLVYADNISTPGPFSIQATTAGVFLTGITPNRQANNSTFTMTLTGAGFEAGTAVELLGGRDAPYSATNVSVDSFTQLTATFPPNLAPPGVYSVRVHQPDGDLAILTNVFTMLEPGAPKLLTRLMMPYVLGRHVANTIYVEYANEGTASMPAPLLVLRSSDLDGSDRPVLTLDENRIVQNYWSAGLPPGTANEIFLLAGGAQPGVLNPGERFLVPVYYLGLQQPWNFSDGQVEMEIRYWTADDPSPIDWNERKETLRPPTLDAATWDVVYANLTAGLATTGDYVRMLNDNAQFLGRLGRRVKSVDDLWNFELQQAYGYSALPVLDSALDSALPTPGVTLNLRRRFASNLRARNSSGWFGRGWYTPWQARLMVQDGADFVKLVGEAGSVRRFSRDIRNNSYFSDAGDTSALVALGGGIYELRDPNGILTRFRSNGRIDYVQDPNGNRTTAAYDAAGRLATLSHSSGASITVAYNGGGFVQGVTNSAGGSVAYRYLGENLQTVTTDDGKVTAYTYETDDAPAQRHALRSVTRGGTTGQFTYNAQGRLASTYVATGEQLVQFGYDSAGGVTVTDAQGTTRLFFDHRSLLSRTIDPLGNVSTAEFNHELRLSRVVTPTGEGQSFTWANSGRPASFTDELGNTTAFRYDNPFNRLTSFTDARGNTTAYTYDPRGNLLSTTYPNNSIERFGSYTALGLPQSHTNRRSQPIAYTFTPSGQVDRQTFADGSFADFDYDTRGNLTNVLEHPATGPDRVTAYRYDYATSGNRLRKVTYPNARWVEFLCDAFGRRERMTDSTGQDLRYDYDATGRLWRLRDAANAVLAEYLYNGAGQVQRLNKGNRTYTTYDYDATSRLLHLINYSPHGSVNTRFDYTYDRRERRRTMGTVDGDWIYEYDATGQLLRGVFASRNATIPNQDLQYIYDDAGNRVRTIENGVTRSYVADNLNQYASVPGTNQQYDADGNLTFDGMNTYEWDQQSRLHRVTDPEGVTEYEYDAFGNRTATVRNGQRAEYLMDPTGLVNVVAEYNGSANLIARSAFGLGLVGRSHDAGSVDYFDFDGIGSTTATTDQSGGISSRYAYDPFGGLLLTSETTPNSFRFGGQFGLMSETSDFYHIRARYYNARNGRFVSLDAPRTPSSDPNHYRYAFNNPVSRIDANGLWSLEISGFAALGAGAGLSV